MHRRILTPLTGQLHLVFIVVIFVPVIVGKLKRLVKVVVCNLMTLKDGSGFRDAVSKTTTAGA